MKKKIIGVLDILLPILLFILLEVANISDYFIDIITLTLVIGWLLPFLMNILSGISFLNDSHHKLAFFANILSFFLCILLIVLMLLIYNKSFIVPILVYIALGILNGINSYFYVSEENAKNEKEWAEIKRIKEQNKGIIK